MKKKTRKAIIKRFKFTASEKILRRPTGQDHYRAKITGKKRRHRRKFVALSMAETAQIKKLLKF